MTIREQHLYIHEHAQATAYAVGTPIPGQCTITTTGREWSTNELVGRTINFYSWGGSPTATKHRYEVVANSQNALVVTGDPPGDGAAVDDWFEIIREETAIVRARSVDGAGGLIGYATFDVLDAKGVVSWRYGPYSRIRWHQATEVASATVTSVIDDDTIEVSGEDWADDLYNDYALTFLDGYREGECYVITDTYKTLGVQRLDLHDGDVATAPAVAADDTFRIDRLVFAGYIENIHRARESGSMWGGAGRPLRRRGGDVLRLECRTALLEAAKREVRDKSYTTQTVSQMINDLISTYILRFGGDGVASSTTTYTLDLDGVTVWDAILRLAKMDNRDVWLDRAEELQVAALSAAASADKSVAEGTNLADYRLLIDGANIYNDIETNILEQADGGWDQISDTDAGVGAQLGFDFSRPAHYLAEDLPLAGAQNLADEVFAEYSDVTPAIELWVVPWGFEGLRAGDTIEVTIDSLNLSATRYILWEIEHHVPGLTRLVAARYTLRRWVVAGTATKEKLDQAAQKILRIVGP